MKDSSLLWIEHFILLYILFLFLVIIHLNPNQLFLQTYIF